MNADERRWIFSAVIAGLDPAFHAAAPRRMVASHAVAPAKESSAFICVHLRLHS
jgi:hypothetical protein